MDTRDLPLERADEKVVIRDAIEAVTRLTIRDVAARLGISVSFMYACADPLRTTRLGSARLTELGDVFRAAAERLLAVADKLDQTAARDRGRAPSER